MRETQMTVCKSLGRARSPDEGGGGGGLSLLFVCLFYFNHPCSCLVHYLFNVYFSLVNYCSESSFDRNEKEVMYSKKKWLNIAWQFRSFCRWATRTLSGIITLLYMQCPFCIIAVSNTASSALNYLSAEPFINSWLSDAFNITEHFKSNVEVCKW